MDNLIKEDLKLKFRNATNRLVLLDYDGTLVDFSPFPLKAIPTKKLLAVLVKIIENPQTTLVIISGRSHQDIDKFLGHLPIYIIAEHGAMIRENGVWKKQIIDNGSWKKTIQPILKRMTLTCPNSFIEEKLFSLSWHYRNTDSKIGYDHSRELIDTLQNIISSNNLKILDGNKVVEIMQNGISKGFAVKNIVEQNFYDFILSIGDDKTDEEMFDFFKYNTAAITIKVGMGSTLAKYKIDNVNNVIAFLEQLAISE